MPELPEVEIVRRSLAPRVTGRLIRSVELLSPLCADNKPAELRDALEGRRIVMLDRHGKHLLFKLDRGVLDVHLRMTGKLLTSGAVSPYTRAVLTLDEGAVLFDDVRQFGRLRYLESPAQLDLGPDALGVSVDLFAEILKGRRGRIKPLLLDQSAIAGIGNIYADESLRLSCIHPRAKVARLSWERVSRLYDAIQWVLVSAIDAGGSSISDYVDADGKRGTYQVLHRVYGRAGKLCEECGSTIRRIVLNQRSTHFCPRCQRY
jgi:formamidopyrimidine-DNA glycosylase